MTKGAPYGTPALWAGSVERRPDLLTQGSRHQSPSTLEEEEEAAQSTVLQRVAPASVVNNDAHEAQDGSSTRIIGTIAKCAETALETRQLELNFHADVPTEVDSEGASLFESMRLAALLVDRQLRIVHFTSDACAFFRITSRDRGRSIAEIPHGFRHADLRWELMQVIHSERPRETHVRALSGDWYLLRIAPSRSRERRMGGAVVTFTQITELKQRENQQALVAELGLRALAEVELSNFLEQGVELVRSGLRVELCEISQLNVLKDELHVLAATGFESNSALLAERTDSSSSAASALKQRSPVLLPGDERRQGVWPARLLAERVASGARIAIGGDNGEVFGLLGVYTRNERIFSKQDLLFLGALANVFTGAVQRRVMEENRLRANEAATLQRSEEQLRRAERLASLGTFAAGVAHELNNPLSNIALSAEYAEKTQDPERLSKLLAAISGNAHRCGRIVESVLRFAKDEATRKWATDINSVVRHAVDLVRSYVGSERIVVTLQLDDPGPQVVCNPTEMEQVFVNLLRNSVEAHPSTCHARIRSERRDERARLTFSDDGPGIPKLDQERIFDPFFSTHRTAGGTGLGLSIIHRIVTAHGGSIRVLSEPGSGATFELDLPCAHVES